MSLVLYSAFHGKISNRLHNTAQVRNLPMQLVLITYMWGCYYTHCTSNDNETSDDDVGSTDDEQAFPNIGTIMYIQNAGSSAKYSICCSMITTGEDDMLVPDFWPEIVPTPEDSLFAYTTPKQSYIKALKKIMQSSALGIPIRSVYRCCAWLLVLL